MVDRDLLLLAGEESVKFIDSMRPDELGIYTIRKAFEMGYLHGANDTLKDVEKLKDWESVAADQALTVAMLKAEKNKPYQFEANMYASDRMQIDATTGNVCIGTLRHSEWVGLTEDDYKALEVETLANNMGYREVLMWADAKLKEKNHGTMGKMESN